MERRISEPDWRLLRQLEPVALDRYCRRVLDDVAALAGDDGRSAHARYLALYELLKERDKDLAVTFNDLRRSTAPVQLAAMRYRGLLTDEEFARFSPDTREWVQLM